jgi:Zinc dependent phospholipase C
MSHAPRREMAPRRRFLLRAFAASLALTGFFAATAPSPALAWDSATHRLITRLAINALPKSPLRDSFEANFAALQDYSVAPDSVLKARYGKAEARRHYINIEYYKGSSEDPFSSLDPDFKSMERRVGLRLMKRAGTLPWTIEELADATARDWRSGKCAELIRQSGYLSHYVGDASQPLHTTVHYDCTRSDRGCHARIEGAVDRAVRALGAEAEPQVRALRISGVWPTEIAEMKQSYGLVQPTIDADRSARRGGEASAEEYERALIAQNGAMFATQIARGASALASIWTYEWSQAGSPDRCSSAVRVSY